MAYNVLIVDDSAVSRSMVRKSIAMARLDVSQVHEADDGRKALDLLSKEWIDIVIADFDTTNMDGFRFIEKMSEDRLLVSIPVIVLTPVASSIGSEDPEKRGCRAYVKKPLRPDALRAIVDDVFLATEEGASHGS